MSAPSARAPSDAPFTPTGLDALVDREATSGAKVVLPVWHEVDHDDVAAYSPLLANKYAARTADGIGTVADEVELALGRTPSAGSGAPASATPPIDCYTEVERIHDVLSPHGREFRDNASVWLHVKNNTATAEFSVRLWNVQGVPRDWGAYAVRHVSWDGTTSTRLEIDGLGGERRVRIANVARDPRGFWFWTVEHGVEECGNQYLISELVDPDTPLLISFEIEIVNHSTAAKLFKRGFIFIPAKDGDSLFTLADMAAPAALNPDLQLPIV
jgi:hypothetical protein